MVSPAYNFKLPVDVAKYIYSLPPSLKKKHSEIYLKDKSEEFKEQVRQEYTKLRGANNVSCT